VWLSLVGNLRLGPSVELALLLMFIPTAVTALTILFQLALQLTFARSLLLAILYFLAWAAVIVAATLSLGRLI
jgi:hypothetical protein